MSSHDGFPELASASEKKEAPKEKDLSARNRFLVSITGMMILSWIMYYWNEQLAQGVQVQDVDIKKPVGLIVQKTLAPTNGMIEAGNDDDDAENDDPTDPPVEIDNGVSDTPAGNATDPPGVGDDDENDDGTDEDAVDEDDEPTTHPTEDVPIESDGSCDALCDRREENRRAKFGGDLLDTKDILRLAKEGRDKTIQTLREAYGDYFDAIFIDGTDMDGEPSYRGMSEVGYRSKDRLKRKLKIKVLKMMENVRASESNVIGCNCMKKQGKADGTPDDSAYEIPDFYEQYVFANGGHSQAAAHGNLYKESYTAYFGDDLRPVWEAIGVDMIDRNYAAGAMKASPFIAACSKEVFGVDVDFLVWNFGMTDKGYASTAYYMYRGAINPGRPALLIVDGAKQAKFVGTQLEAKGLSLFQSTINLAGVPDSTPDGIPLTSKELEMLPELVQYLKVNKGLEGGNDVKWSCSPEMQEAGSDCVCPAVPSRSAWHMGYRAHALQGRLISLPFIEIMIEALSEIAASTSEAMSLLLGDIQKEESQDYEMFLTESLPQLEEQQSIESHFGEGLTDETLLNTWFKGPSLCRTSLLPSASRFLGLTTNTTKVGDVSRCGDETYDTGVSIQRYKEKKDYDYLTEVTPTPGEFNIVAPIDFRSCYKESECPEIVMPDYKDWFWGVLKDGKVSVTMPNEKEKEYYGYDPKNFKGIIGLVPTNFLETKTKDKIGDIPIKEFQDHVKITVNGKAVAKYRLVNDMVILEDEGGSVFWEPSSNSDYFLEFEPFGEFDDGEPAADRHLRLSGFVLY